MLFLATTAPLCAVPLVSHILAFSAQSPQLQAPRLLATVRWLDIDLCVLPFGSAVRFNRHMPLGA